MLSKNPSVTTSNLESILLIVFVGEQKLTHFKEQTFALGNGEGSHPSILMLLFTGHLPYYASQVLCFSAEKF